ncbi:hypothetical protein MMC34_002224 [Xylographa carneopallida]|nr:hypothetical protein [Xylographa carneopallida]
MRLRRKVAVGPLLLLSIPTPTTASSSVSLSQFQQIYGFSATCTAAYNTDIPGCTASDFTSNNPCSINCISGLEAISALLNSACQGTEADPNTLIGLFFEGNGVSALCPNVVSGSTPQSSPGGQGGGISMTTTTSTVSEASVVTTSSKASTPTTVSTSERPSPTTTTTSALSHMLGSSTVSPVTKTTTVASSSSTKTSQSALTSVLSSLSLSTATAQSASLRSSITQAGSGFTKTVVNDGTAVLLTSKPEQTASDNPDAFGGGGSPFEISNQSIRAADVLWMMYGPVICMTLLCFV